LTSEGSLGTAKPIQASLDAQTQHPAEQLGLRRQPCNHHDPRQGLMPARMVANRLLSQTVGKDRWRDVLPLGQLQAALARGTGSTARNPASTSSNPVACPRLCGLITMPAEPSPHRQQGRVSRETCRTARVDLLSSSLRCNGCQPVFKSSPKCFLEIRCYPRESIFD